MSCEPLTMEEKLWARAQLHLMFVLKQLGASFEDAFHAAHGAVARAREEVGERLRREVADAPVCLRCGRLAGPHHCTPCQRSKAAVHLARLLELWGLEPDEALSRARAAVERTANEVSGGGGRSSCPKAWTILEQVDPS